MFKIIAALLLLSISLPCFSKESCTDFKTRQSKALDHISDGSINLFLNQPWRALSDFQKAATLVDKSDTSSSAISFLISFGQVVAYDSLGFREQCKQSIGSLLLAINEYDDENYNSEYSMNNNSPASDEYEEAVDFLRSIAALAPSPDVRELLFSFVDQIADELLPAFKFAEGSFLGAADWSFDQGRDNATTLQCKSVWKKFKKWCVEVVHFLSIVKEGYKHAKDIKKTYDEWHNQQN